MLSYRIIESDCYLWFFFFLIRYFSLLYDGIVVVNVILICLNVDAADWFFVALYVAEIALKWYSFGTKRYFYNFQNW